MRSSAATMFCSVLPSPIGPLTVVVSDRGVVHLEFGAKPRMFSESMLAASPDQTSAIRAELDEYFAGTRQRFSLELDLRGTSFQQLCWSALRDIPYGETRSYAEIARSVGRPHAFRAVGMANHANPVPIIVPCHRVIGTNGKLTGYGGGLHIKQKLLELERQHCALTPG